MFKLRTSISLSFVALWCSKILQHKLHSVFRLPDNVETLEQRHHVSSRRGGSYHELVEPRPHGESHPEVHAPLNPRGQAVSLSTNYLRPR